jgi:hypothetical protein
MNDLFITLIILLILTLFIYTGSILWNIYSNLELFFYFNIINSIKGWLVSIYIFTFLYSFFVLLEHFSII